MTNITVPEVPGFEVGRVLGRGGSATVWLVTEEKTGRDFALKCLGSAGGTRARVRVAGLPGPAGEEAIRREIRILSVLDHQHLIKAHDAVHFVGSRGSGESGGGTGLLLDYAPGGSLADLVGSRGKLTVGETVTVLTPIAQVLGYLHGKGFTHGDVSPGNVLFTGHGKPMLSDVGIARMVGDVASVPDHGTAGFMDPAPVDAVRAGLQPERDVYAVAALGWYCLTGEPPRRTADRPPMSLLLPDVPPELAAALEAGLNEDRRLRPTAVELATAVYRSAPPLPVDLASSVHPTVLPQLLTRRRVPERRGDAVRNGFRACGRRISTSRWSGLVRAHQVLPFPQGEHAVPPQRRTEGVARRKHARAATRGPGRGTVLLAAGAAAMVAAAIWTASAFGPGGPWAAEAGSGALPVSSEAAKGGDATGSQDAAGNGPKPADSLMPEEVTTQLHSTDPAEAVRGLAAARSLALSSGRLELLDLVNAPGSAASVADTRIRDELQASGNILAGFTSTVSDLQVQPGSSAGQAVVAVTSATSSYEERDGSGALVASAPEGAEQQLRLVLVAVDGKWRITDVLPGL
ncbi:protein kinase domain-containing protein [Pseudarthrobacter sp. DSP2-3-2b1]|uniref:protein kinase domain-containing protein n=1 Tax=Pseudarthrobacter sp. DSP2-3-2b1 TaxID=2804661 RepID=UPI003CF48E7D